MSFSPDVKTKALIACGRHCTICHKFCGTKIECHHIRHEGEGGPDTFDNCIPLCFNCHADMRSYDAKHPKGTKYSPEELSQHRDRWYAKVADGGGIEAVAEHRVVDQAVFASLQEQVPYYPAFDYLRGRNFAGFSFERVSLEPFFRYAHYSDRVEYEFIDAELESARGEFATAVRHFTELIALNTWPTHLDGYSAVPAEWEEEQPERFRRVVLEIHESADAMERAYAQIVRLARRRLGVVGVIEPATRTSDESR